MSISDNIPFGIRQASRIRWYKYAAPQTFFPIAGKLIPWFAVLALILGVIGLYVGFVLAPFLGWLWLAVADWRRKRRWANYLRRHP